MPRTAVIAEKQNRLSANRTIFESDLCVCQVDLLISVLRLIESFLQKLRNVKKRKETLFLKLVFY